MSTLEQGDIIEVDFSPSLGHKPAKLRPAVVVSGFGFNSRSSLVSLVPITTTDNGYPLHVPLKAPSVAGFACVEQLRNIDIIQRGYTLLAAATDKDMRVIMGTIRGMLELH
ncbi:MAG: type II toxin-antitoxin system PemK/MazF family toxin [Coriobacteriales bacterium]|nr:type II toxin-antitoxin system PemK/MazF family toxin [Coriobacteriales bacterium]